ncbi:MAG: PBP1A family penicillin-binding protein [Proteobacteria bacterium]|nr:PBP1A family penicillin-binding protein [Pseudomonadota bacterium]
MTEKPKRPEKKRAPKKAPNKKGGEKSEAAKPALRRRIFKYAALTLLWVTFGLALLLAYWAYKLPDVDAVLAETRPPIITILDRHDKQIAVYGGKGGSWIKREDIPPVLIQAVLAIEDRRFYEHSGVDLLGILRALLANIRAGDLVQGGSTVTQQLAKNLFLTPDRTIKRKVQEAMVAYALEGRLTKDEILEQYLNRVYLGSGAYGAEAASRRYFDKPVGAVSIPQAALLAGLLKAPSGYSPLNDAEAANGRTAVVLDAMVEAGYLIEEERLKLGDPVIASRSAGDSARYFMDWIVAELPDFAGEPTQDLVVKTTFDPVIQTAAQRALAFGFDGVPAEWKVTQGALVAMSPSGEVRAMVGGRNYGQSEFNRAVRALRQPGSAFKLFVYLAGFEAGMTPESRMRDSPIMLEGWQPKNYGGKFEGSMTLRTAFAKSINTIAVKLAEQADRTRVINAAMRLGITTPVVKQPSTALGTTDVRLLDITGAYAVFANDGMGVSPHAITSVAGNDGVIVYERLLSSGRVVDPIQVEQMRSVLREVVLSGTGRGASLSGRFAAGKTGTSQALRDAWFIGFGDDLVAGVWVGNDDSSAMKRVTGGGLPARIWKDFMTRAGR